MKILKTIIGIEGESVMLKADTIEHDGKLWLVPKWIELPTEGHKTPARIICLDTLQYQKAPPAYADFALTAPMPRVVLEGHDPAPAERGYLVVEMPDIRVPMRRDVH